MKNLNENRFEHYLKRHVNTIDLRTVPIMKRDKDNASYFSYLSTSNGIPGYIDIYYGISFSGDGIWLNFTI